MKQRKTTRLSFKKKKSTPFIIAWANKILNDIDFVQEIDFSVRWDEKQWEISPGNLFK